MITFEIEQSSLRRLQNALEEAGNSIREKAKDALVLASELGATEIAETFDGSTQGFYNRTGELRKSILGGAVPDDAGAVLAHISAGDDSIGSNGLRTRDYVARVEYPELRTEWLGGANPRNTAFLRPGTMMISRMIVSTVSKEMKPIFDRQIF